MASTSPEQGGASAEPALQNKTQALGAQIDGVVGVMEKNIKRMLDREEKLFDLIDMSKEMEKGAHQFNRTSATVARSYWWKNVKLIVALVAVVLIVVLIIILLATGVIPVSAPVPPTVNPTDKP